MLVEEGDELRTKRLDIVIERQLHTDPTYQVLNIYGAYAL